jgi:hypothetical protein
MTFRIVAIPLLAAICAGSPAWASGTDGTGGEEQQRRRDRGADNRGYRGRSGPRPRVAVPVVRPNININIGNRGPRFYGPSDYDRWARNRFRWAPWGLISFGAYRAYSAYGAYGAPGVYGAYGAYGAHGAYGAPYAHYAPYAQYAPGYGADFGGIRLSMRPRDAQVFVDGYYAGIVDDFDGTFQQLRLEPGAHKIEVRMPGFEDLELDVFVQPGRTINIHEDLRPRP